MIECPFCGEVVARRVGDLTDHFVECPCAPVAHGGGFEREIAGILAANQFSFAVSEDVCGVSEVA